VLANCWGMLLIIMVLGYSIVDVAKKFKKKLSLNSELEYNYVKIFKQKQKLEELGCSLEFKIATIRGDIKSITDEYSRKKFEHLLNSLPIEVKDTPEMDDSTKHYFKEEINVTQFGDFIKNNNYTIQNITYIFLPYFSCLSR
jgi:hypothetical protein